MMRRAAELRAPPRLWRRVLGRVYPYLRQAGVGDLLVYGSQALSAFARTPLRSKDLDLVSGQAGLRLWERLGPVIAQLNEGPTTKMEVLARRFDDHVGRTYVYRLQLGGYPFAVELFDYVFNGKSPAILTRHTMQRQRWGLEFWVPEPAALTVVRLAFRPPERITRFNAIRLNRFLAHARPPVDLHGVRALIEEFGVRQQVEDNLVQLFRQHRIRIRGDRIFAPDAITRLRR